MKKYITTILAVAIVSAGAAQAQEYKIAKSSGRLELNLGRVMVEGHSGNEIIFTSEKTVYCTLIECNDRC